MSEELIVLLTSRKGLTLFTKGTYINKDIVIVPQFEGGETAIIANGKTITIENALVTIEGGNTISIGG